MKSLFRLALCLTFGASVFAQQTAVPNNGALPWTYGPYSYDPAGNITAIGNQSFVYDPMGRLVKSSTAMAPQQQMQQPQDYTYDVYGNITEVNTSGMTTTFTVDASSNHVTSANVTYDAAGNVTTWQPSGSAYQRNYTYDPLSRLMEERVTGSGDVVYHVYTADDERYWTYTAHGSSAVSHFTIRDLGGQVLRDYKLEGTTYSVFRDYVYRDGILLASIVASGAQHISVDHLGSPRLLTDDSGYRVGAHTYLPFGSEWSNGAAQEGDTLKFTGHERDASFVATEANGLDYMHARFYSSNLGRFTAVDPILGNTSEPQTWNRYTYTVNSPLENVDPDGEMSTWFSSFNAYVFNAFVTSDTITVVDSLQQARNAGEADSALRDAEFITLAQAVSTERDGLGRAISSFLRNPTVYNARGMMGHSAFMQFADISDEATAAINPGLTMFEGASTLPSGAEAIRLALNLEISSYRYKSGGRAYFNISRNGRSGFRLDKHAFRLRGSPGHPGAMVDRIAITSRWLGIKNWPWTAWWWPFR